MATFETKLLNEYGLFHHTPLSEEVSNEVMAFTKKIAEISQRENLSIVEMNLIETHIHSLVGIEFSELRLREGAKRFKERSERFKAEQNKKQPENLEPSPGGGFQPVSSGFRRLCRV